MAAIKLILLSCLVAGLGYFAYRELQVDTLGFTINIHIPAKRSDVFQKLFDEPEFNVKVHPLCTGVSNIVRFKDKDGQRVIQYDIQERAVLLAGLHDTGNFTFQVTVKEIEENTATQLTATLMGGMVQINQGFHLTDSQEGGTLLEDHAAYTAPRLLARFTRIQARAAHTKITENIVQYFIDISQQAKGNPNPNPNPITPKANTL